MPLFDIVRDETRLGSHVSQVWPGDPPIPRLTGESDVRGRATPAQHGCVR